MNCRNFKAKVAHYVDQELSGSEMIAMQHHCRDCSECACELKREQELKSMLASLQAPQPSAEFESKLFDAVRAQGNQVQPVRIWRPWRTAAVAAIAGAAIVFGALQTIDRKPALAQSDPIDFSADQAVQGTQDPFGGTPVVTVSSGQP
ncbi:MAG: hypothetical protein JNK63_05690 [Chthonomonas sp.]|nr:hypothetical protein [Chthonomonas sp.]